MSEQQKNAYRHLLYWAMLDIRIRCQPYGRPSINPFEWYRRYRAGLIAGAIADWLHNLAGFAAYDFEGFDEKRFWDEHSGLCKRFPDADLEHFIEATNGGLCQGAKARHRVPSDDVANDGQPKNFLPQPTNPWPMRGSALLVPLQPAFWPL